MQKKILFAAESLYQLFNVIIMRMTEHDDDVCDIVLGSQTKWREDMILRLRNAKLFNNTIIANTASDQDFFFGIANPEERKLIYGDPIKYFRSGVFAEPDYDEIYLPVDHIPWKMFYYYSRQYGKNPAVHMYDEGLRAYTMPIMDSENTPSTKGVYKDDEAFPKAIVAYHLHRPQLYSVQDSPFEKVGIASPLSNEQCAKMLIYIYGADKIPDEKFIYLEDYFFADGYQTNDFNLFKTVANLVGKDNVIVKRHPRDKFDRFKPFGFKEVKCSVVPWEIQLLSHDYSQKVLISVTSTSLMTPFLIFDMPLHVISLENMFRGENKTHQDVAFPKFMNAFRSMVNSKETRWHSPRSVEELSETLLYVDFKLRRAKEGR